MGSPECGIGGSVDLTQIFDITLGFPIWVFISWAWLLVVSYLICRLKSTLKLFKLRIDDVAERQKIFHPMPEDEEDDEQI